MIQADGSLAKRLVLDSVIRIYGLDINRAWTEVSLADIVTYFTYEMCMWKSNTYMRIVRLGYQGGRKGSTNSKSRRTTSRTTLVCCFGKSRMGGRINVRWSGVEIACPTHT